MSILDSLQNSRVDVCTAIVPEGPGLVIDEDMVFDDLVKQKSGEWLLWVSFSIDGIILNAASCQKIFKRNYKVFSEYLPDIPYVSDVSDVCVCRTTNVIMSSLRMSVGINLDVSDNALAVYRTVSAIIGVMSHIKSAKMIELFWFNGNKIDGALFLKNSRLLDSGGIAYSYNIRQICRHVLGRPASTREMDRVKKIVDSRELRSRIRTSVTRSVNELVGQSLMKLKMK